MPSAQEKQGRRVDGAEAVFAWRANSGSIALWGLALTLALLIWERLAANFFALSYGGEVTDLRTLMADILLSGKYLPLLFVYFAVGGIFAFTVFVFGVVTAPMLLDREVDVVTAALTSLRACLANPGATLVWAALIAVLTALGFATAMIGMVIIFPVLETRELARVPRSRAEVSCTTARGGPSGACVSDARQVARKWQSLLPRRVRAEIDGVVHWPADPTIVRADLAVSGPGTAGGDLSMETTKYLIATYFRVKGDLGGRQVDVRVPQA